MPDSDAHQRITQPLRRLRARARRLLLAERLAIITAAITATLLALGPLDFALRFPQTFRGALLLAGIGAILWTIARIVRPAARFNPSLTTVALRVEHATPELRGKLASALELGQWPGTPPHSHGVSDTGMALAELHTRSINHQLTNVRPADILRPERARRGLAFAAAAVAILLAATLIEPTAVRTSAARLLTPWSDAAWPKRFAVADATNTARAPRGEALALRAVLLRAPSPLREADVRLEYRTAQDEGPATSPITAELMTYQGDPATRLDQTVLATIDTPESPVASAALFERIVRADAHRIEYRFVTADDATPWRSISLVPRPAVLAARAEFTPPAYAAGLNAGAPSDAVLGPGDDERAFAPRQLAGTRAQLTITTNKPATADIRTLRDGTLQSRTTIQSDNSGITLNPTLDSNLRIEIQLTDRFGIESAAPAVYRFEGAADRAAAATVTEPTSDLTVLPTAIVPTEAEARDDVALAWVALERAHLRPALGSGSGAAATLEPVTEPTFAEQRFTDTDTDTDAESRRLTATADIDLRELDATPGDRIRLTAVAADIRAALVEGVDPTRSAPRTLRVIDEAAFVDEIRVRLNEVRAAAIRTDDAQQQAQRTTLDEGATRDARREQGDVGERIAQQTQTLDTVRERIQRNRLADDRLADLLDAVDTALERAGVASNRASERLAEAVRRAAEQGQEPPELTQREAEDVAIDQDAVRDALAEIVSRLDRGEDDWVVRNELARLAREQRNLEQRTADIGTQTAGRDADDLTEQQREQLEAVRRDQQELAERTERLIDDMRDRARELRESDPVTSRSLDQAAAGAEESRVNERMQRAAEAAADNRTNEAREQQQQAADALEQALEDLEQGERARAEVLRRVLASVEESLEQLIADQTAELDRLNDAIDADDPIAPLAPAMIAINRNTLAVTDQLRTGGPEAAPAISLVARAETAQVEAITALRNDNPEAPDDARRAEQRSLTLLEQALERVRTIDDELEEEQRQRTLEALREAYTDILRTAVEIDDAARPFADTDNPTRRQRASMRRLANRADQLAEALTDAGTQLDTLDGIPVADFAHDRAQQLTAAIAEHLRQGDGFRAAWDTETLVGVLRGLVEALAEQQDPNADRPFDEGAQAQQGQQGQGQGEGQNDGAIPPAKQLKLLRTIMTGVADRTRRADTLPAGDRRRDALAQLARESRDLSRVGAGFLEDAMQGGDLSDLFPDPPNNQQPPDDGQQDPDQPRNQNNDPNEQPNPGVDQ